MAKKIISDIERFFKSVEISIDGCWIWQRSTDKDGYGLFRIGSLTDGTRCQVRAARWAFEQFKNEITNGFEIDHLCRVRACVNPDHLEAVSHAENRYRARKEFCKRGHRASEENIYTWKGIRRCRLCAKEVSRRYREGMPGGWSAYVRKRQQISRRGK